MIAKETWGKAFVRRVCREVKNKEEKDQQSIQYEEN